MNKIIYFLMFVLLLLNYRIYSQEYEEKINSLSHSVSFGWSNPISLTRSILNPSQDEKIGFLIDYQVNNNEENFYRIHLKFSPFYSQSTFTMDNFLVSFIKGK